MDQPAAAESVVGTNWPLVEESEQSLTETSRVTAGDVCRLVCRVARPLNSTLTPSVTMWPKCFKYSGGEKKEVRK